MLSIHKIETAKSALDYFKTGEYYQSGTEKGLSSWYGKGAEKLGLSGEVDFDKFEKLLNGELPDGTVLPKATGKDGEYIRRPGYDLTFTACKAASILYLIGGDERIKDAFNSAVENTIDKIEKEYISSRVKKNGKTTTNNTGNLISASFDHKTSRELDPNMHRHCVIMNATEFKDVWRALHFDNIYDFKKHFGLLMRSDFAEKLMELGYEIELTGKEGLFEIKGVDNLANIGEGGLLRNFSKRRESIENVLKESGLGGQDKLTMTVNKGTKFERKVKTVASTMANYVTRKRSHNLTLDEIQDRWDDEVKNLGCSKDKIIDFVEQAKTRGPITQPESLFSIEKIKPLVLEHINHMGSELTPQNLKYIIRAFCIESKLPETLLDKHIKSMLDSGELMKKSNYYTTSKLEQVKKGLISEINRGLNTKPKMLPIGTRIFSNLLARNNQEKSLISKILTNKDQVMVVDYNRISEFKNITNKAMMATSYEVISISDTVKNAKYFNNDGSKGAFTSSGFVEYTDRLIENNHSSKNSYAWVISNADKIKSRDLLKLLQNAEKLNARVILGGDSMASTRKNKINHFGEIVSKTEHVKLDLSSGSIVSKLKSNIDKSMELLDKAGVVREVASDDLLQHAINSYVKNQDLSLISQNEHERNNLNIALRSDLGKKGLLGGSEHKIRTLNLIPLNKYQKQSVGNYQVGDYVRFNKSIQNTQFQQGKYYYVLSIDNDIVSVANDLGENIQLPISQATADKISIYRSEFINIKEGDKLAWGEMTPRGVEGSQYNGKQFTVSAINEKIIDLTDSNGEKHKLSKNNLSNLHLKYDYAKLPNEISKVKTSLMVVNTNSYPQYNSSDIYQVAKNTEKEFNILCDSKSGLKDLLTNEENVKNESIKIDSVDKPDSYHYSQDAVGYAISNLVEKDLTFFKEDVFDVAKKYNFEIKPKDLDDRIAQSIENGTLIRTSNQEKITYVGKTTFDKEKHILQQQSQGNESCKSILAPESSKIHDISNHKRLTLAQKNALTMILTTRDRINVVQGIAGAGKTTMLKELRKYARESGVNLIGVTPTASTRNNLQEKTSDESYDRDDPRTFAGAGIESHTLKKFTNGLVKLEQNNGLAESFKRDTIVVMDEASMASLDDMKILIEASNKSNFKVVLIGDDRQLSSVNPSNAFHLLLGNSKNPSILNINTRFKTVEAVELMKSLYSNDVETTFKQLDDNIFEVKDKGERISLMVDDYMSIPKEQRFDTAMVMLPENKDKAEFNKLVRQKLIAESTLGDEKINTTVLQSINLTNKEAKHSLNYHGVEKLLFNQSIARLGINRGDYLTVVSAKEKVINLIDKSGNEISLDLSRFRLKENAIEAFNEQNRDIRTGEIIRWNKNFPHRSLFNSETAKVIKIEGDNVTFNLENGMNITLDMKDKSNQHWDYAYASTVYAAQGRDRLISISMLEESSPTTTMKNLLVQATRGDHLLLYTDSKQGIMDKLGRSEKETAIEVLSAKSNKDFNKRIDSFFQNLTGIAEKKSQLIKAESKITDREPNKIRYTKDDIEDIKSYLKHHALEYATSWLGSPISATEKEARWGKKGSFLVKLSGANAGHWYDFEQGKGGNNLISLYMHTNNLGRKDWVETLEYLSKSSGFDVKKLIIQTPKLSPITKESTAEEKAIKANKTYSKGVSLNNTLGEKYFKNIRGINVKLPRDFRFHDELYHYQTGKNHPAIIIPARDNKGKIVAISRIYLDPNGNKLTNPDSENIKLFNSKLAQGATKAATIDINNGVNKGVCYVSEGVENALTIKQFKPSFDIKSCVGISQLKHIKFNPGTHTVVIVADNDLTNTNTKAGLIQAIDNYKEQGLNIEVVMPKSHTFEKKLDLNDLLLSGKDDEVKSTLSNSTPVKSGQDLGPKNEPLQTSIERLEKIKIDKLDAKIISNEDKDLHLNTRDLER